MPGTIMRSTFSALRLIIRAIAILVFVAGVVLTLLGILDMVMAFSHIRDTDVHDLPGILAVGLLKGVDMFLIAIVFFVFSIGVLILFAAPDTPLPIRLPEWLRLKNFMQLKVILWEAILTTMVISFLAGLAEQRLGGHPVTVVHLVIPGCILIISMSLFFLKKGEH
jgi:uncharacterized membrane protein YqhA